MSKPKSMSNCHPEKFTHAKGLCAACYTAWRKTNVAGVREKHRAGSKKWLKKNPEYAAASTRKSRYGLTAYEFTNLVNSQNGRCAICKEKKKLCVDHCHKTMQVRGLLCHACNLALGLYERLVDKGDVPAYLNNKTGFIATKNRAGGKF